MNIIEKYNKKKIEAVSDIPAFKAGDTIDVHVRISDGATSRVQLFRGLCIARKNRSLGSTFTVRKICSGSIGVERVFPLYSPQVEKISVYRQGKVRRSKIYYIRNLRGKSARIKSKLVASS